MIVSQIILLITTFLVGINLSFEEQKVEQNTRSPRFGRAMRQQFLLDPNFIFLNHGSYGKHQFSSGITCTGTYPKAVQEALHAYQNRAENNPDLWLRRGVRPELDKVRGLLAKLINASAEDIVMIINTTNAMSAIFRSMVFASGERILHFSTVFRSMGSLIKYICDYSNGAVSALVFNVTYPISNDEIVRRFDAFLKETHNPAQPIRIALIDHITSVPGVIVPIERIIPLLKARNITVIVDGAHAIGQIRINITELQPDYYISNCHKWLYSPRGSAMMYVNKKFQGTIHPAHINYGYTQPADYQEEFFWTGTMDYSPYMAIPAALKFREDVGGEEAIMSFNHGLAVDGGNYLAKMFGTEVLQDKDQIGNMVDVRLPINNPDNRKLITEFWVDTQLYRFPQVFALAYEHGGQWFLRMSAQIYNDIHDFKVLGTVFNTICDEINGNNSTAFIR